MGSMEALAHAKRTGKALAAIRDITPIVQKRFPELVAIRVVGGHSYVAAGHSRGEHDGETWHPEDVDFKLHTLGADDSRAHEIRLAVDKMLKERGLVPCPGVTRNANWAEQLGRLESDDPQRPYAMAKEVFDLFTGPVFGERKRIEELKSHVVVGLSKANSGYIREVMKYLDETEGEYFESATRKWAAAGTKTPEGLRREKEAFESKQRLSERILCMMAR